ncbi:MAG: ThiJ/PfpI family protein [Myxococcaceae bacterium]|nr:ThiJ/PfpI family protein [Myxococcaceae bacterium]
MRNPFSSRGKLYGKKIAILAADGFEYVELRVPQRALWIAGAEHDVISLHGGRIRGMNLTEPTRTVRVDQTFETADPSAYDGVLIPGGFIGPDFLRQSAQARAFVRHFDAQGKPIATLCHGPWLLASADLLAGRTLASWPGIRDDLVHAGATWRNEALVVDRNLVTSRGPQDLAAFVPAMLELFATGSVTQHQPEPSTAVEGSSPQMEYPLEMALKAARIFPGPGVTTLASAAALTAAGAFALRRAS